MGFNWWVTSMINVTTNKRILLTALLFCLIIAIISFLIFTKDHARNMNQEDSIVEKLEDINHYATEEDRLFVLKHLDSKSRSIKYAAIDAAAICHDKRFATKLLSMILISELPGYATAASSSLATYKEQWIAENIINLINENKFDDERLGKLFFALSNKDFPFVVSFLEKHIHTSNSNLRSKIYSALSMISLSEAKQLLRTQLSKEKDEMLLLLLQRYNKREANN